MVEKRNKKTIKLTENYNFRYYGNVIQYQQINNFPEFLQNKILIYSPNNNAV